MPVEMGNICINCLMDWINYFSMVASCRIFETKLINNISDGFIKYVSVAIVRTALCHPTFFVFYSVKLRSRIPLHFN